MRIFYAAQSTANGVHLPQSRIWYYNLYTSLRDMGHELVTTDVDFDAPMTHAEDPAWIEANRPVFIEKLLNAVQIAHRKRPLDLFFSYFYSSCITPEAVEQIRAWGIPTVNFSCNNVHQFRLVHEIASAYDYCMVPEQATLDKFRAVGANPIHIQMAANPDIYKSYDLPREFDVIFVGQRYADRPSIIDCLLRQGIDVRVWGPGWLSTSITMKREVSASSSVFSLPGKAFRSGRQLPQKVIRQLALSPMERRLRRIAGPALSDAEMIEMYSRSHLTLGFSVVNEEVDRGRANSHLRLRDFEAPMCGALYVTGYTDELANYFELDKEVLVYRSKEELVEKAKYYLAHPAEAERTRQAARRRALDEHTWKHRFVQLFKIVFGSSVP